MSMFSSKVTCPECDQRVRMVVIGKNKGKPEFHTRPKADRTHGRESCPGGYNPRT